MLMELGWNHDRNRPFREMSAVFLFTILYREKRCEGHDSDHPSPDRKQGHRLRTLQEKDLDYHLQAIVGN